jgi:hypothetical protein
VLADNFKMGEEGYARKFTKAGTRRWPVSFWYTLWCQQQL